MADRKLSMTFPDAEDAALAALEASRVAGNLGDVLGGLHDACVAQGRLAGRVETLLWCQAEIKQQMASVESADRFADTRALNEFLRRVQDSLRLVQDGSGTWDGLLRSALDGPVTAQGEEVDPPSHETSG